MGFTLPQHFSNVGSVIIKQVMDAKGNEVDPPRTIEVDTVQSLNFDSKLESKQAHGQNEYALAFASGKRTASVKLEFMDSSAEMLNTLFFGNELTTGSKAFEKDECGTVLAENYSSRILIQNIRTLHLGKWVANTGVTIKQGAAFVAATLVTNPATVLASGQYRVTAARYEYSSEDVGKQSVITWICADKTTQGGVIGTTVTTTITIPARKTFNLNLFTGFTSVSGTGLTALTPNLATAVGLNQYQAHNNGVFIIGSATITSVFAARDITHVTDGLTVKSRVAILPAAGYNAIINPPSAASYTNDDGVTLQSGTVAGLAVGDAFTKSATPITAGLYDADVGGIYTFSATDAGAFALASYLTDFLFITMTPTNGDFLDEAGVKDENGIHLTRVAFVLPLALTKDQFAMGADGTFYFGATRFGQKLFINILSMQTTGVTLGMVNNKMGNSNTVQIFATGEYDGQKWMLELLKAKPTDFGLSSKMGDTAYPSVTFEILAERGCGKSIGAFNMAA